ncbi:uncharacterized protein V6R79_016266 [Siganus canaliculatus]
MLSPRRRVGSVRLRPLNKACCQSVCYQRLHYQCFLFVTEILRRKPYATRIRLLHENLKQRSASRLTRMSMPSPITLLK